MNNWFKRNGTHLAIIGIFILICFFYLTPAFQGKTLGQSDVIGAQSTQKEINDYRAKDTTILWTNQIFGGMPTFQIWAPYPNNITTHIVSAVKVLPNPVDTLLILLVGAYFLFIVLKLNPWLAAAGAVAFTFSTYNIILLVAGHANQAFAIAFFAPLLASIIMTLRGNYLTGGALTAFFMAMEIRANHIQMTYYLMLAILILVGIELYHAVKGKTLAAFGKAIGFLAAATLLALAVNASILWSTYDYGTETIRGKSNLKKSTSEPSNGLDRDYAYQYSQGVEESMTFLVPNAAGGGSGESNLDQNSNVAKVFTSKGATEEQAVGAAGQIGSSIPGFSTYWGPKRPFTFGPYYFGAVIVFLFVLGLIIVRSRLKWWILGTVVLTMLLSFGGNFPFVSDIFFNYFPLYNKFRAVESILAVTGLCFPILAFLAVREFITNPDKAAMLKKLMLAFYITGGITLVLAVYPQLILSFKSFDHVEGISALAQGLKGDTQTANDYANALIKDRIAMERADAIRSLILVAISFGLLWAYIKNKLKLTAMSIAFLAIVLFDMWQIDKRYLKDASFQDKQEAAQVVQPREVDTFIMKDTDPNFRVFDMSVGAIKQDTYSPFFHKSIGGYSAARLKRVDELIDNQFSKSINQDVLDMLNVKYIITPDQKTGAANMQANSTACGNAWFVQSVKYVKDADEEMQAISSFSPKSEAMIDQQYKKSVESMPLGSDVNGTIKLVKYEPQHLIYQTSSAANQVAVFSEVYYNKGWKMLIDGKEQPYYRADYLLRAATIPLGNHKVEFVFHPASYYTGEGISMAGSVLLVLALGGAAFAEYKRKKGEPVKV